MQKMETKLAATLGITYKRLAGFLSKGACGMLVMGKVSTFGKTVGSLYNKATKFGP
jgi:hypothetical protein